MKQNWYTVYPKKYAHGFCFAVLCCGYTSTDFPISIRLTSLALWQSNDCPSASKATLMNMDKYFMWIHYERLHNHNKAKHNKTVCIFFGIYCSPLLRWWYLCKQCTCTSIRIARQISNLGWLLLCNVQNCILLNKLLLSSSFQVQPLAFRPSVLHDDNVAQTVTFLDPWFLWCVIIRKKYMKH